MILSSRQVPDVGELTRAPAVSVLMVPHALIDLQYPNPCETGRILKCGLQIRLDIRPHGIPRGCELSGEASDGGSLKTQRLDRRRIAHIPKRAREHTPCGSAR